MGVKGLWRLLLPIGRRISIETLEGKILAIDASIWLTQFLKAMRDPDTGSVRPAAHLIGFFRRLCKLRFHGIRPVLVFDGATPEIKKREIQQRRQRREQLFASHESNAVQRMAKRILAAELKKSGKKNVVKPGAYAPGFRLAEEDKKNEASAEQDDAKQSAKTNDSKESESSQIASKDAPTSESVIDLVGEWEEPTQDESENLWGKEVEPEEEESQGQDESDSDYDPSSDTDKNHKSVFDIDQVASLAPHARKDAIEDARRRQRMRSRREFMPVAAQPSEYSQVQLRNFLRSSRLNQQIQKMAVQTSDRNDAALGERMASDATRRIIFTKDKPKAVNGENANQRKRAPIDDDEEYEWQDDDDTPTRAGQSSTEDGHDRIPSDDKEERKHQVSGEESEGGFLVATSSNGHLGHAMGRVIDIDEDSEEEGGGGFLVETASNTRSPRPETELAHTTGEERSSDRINARLAQEINDEVLARGIQESELDMSGEVATSQDVDRPRTAAVSKDAALAAQLQVEEDDGQTKNVSLVKDALASSMGQAQVLQNDDDDSEDDVDWEDGDEGQNDEPLEKSHDEQVPQADERVAGDAALAAHLQAEEDERPEVSSPMHGKAGSSLKTPMGTDGDDSDGSVDWEGGERGGANGVARLRNEEWKPLGQGASQAVTGPGSHDGAANKEVDLHLGKAALRSNTKRLKHFRQDEDDEMQAMFEEQSSDNGLANDFGKTQHVDATAAALEHAQATASNLTDWAGRAFRRAIAKHAKETGRSVPLHRSLSKEEEESLMSNGEIDLESEIEEPNDTSTNMVGKGSAFSGRNPSDALVKEKRVADVDLGAAESKPALLKGDADNSRKAHFAPMDPLQDPLSSLQQQEVILAEESKRYQRDMDTVTDEMKEEVISLIQLFGIPYVEAPAEAEAQCAALEELGLVDGIVTEDSDVFVFGGRNVYKNIFDDQKYVEAYLAKDAERDLALGRNEVVALAMLLGGDYTEGVKGVGIVNGMEVLQAFDVSRNVKEGLGRFRQWLDGFDPADSVGLSFKGTSRSATEQFFHEKHRSARTRWTAPKDFPADNVINAYLNPVVDKSRERFSWGTPDKHNLILFCQRNMGWEATETERLVSPVIEKIESGSRQTRIESFFMAYEDDIKFAKVQSKRLRDVFRGRKNANGNTEPDLEPMEDTDECALNDDGGEADKQASLKEPSRKRNKRN